MRSKVVPIKVPVFKPWVTELEKSTVAKAVADANIALGPDLEAFADKIRALTMTRYCLTTNNGTAACFLAVAAHRFPSGSEIIVPDITFIATANACVYAGCVPIPVDVCRDTWCIDPAEVERAITKRTVAIMPVHLYGRMCDMDALAALCRRHHLVLIEDACEALGSYAGGRAAGGFGKTAALSFYGNKTITTGEGGAFLTNDSSLYEYASLLHGQGQTDRYIHAVVGYNLRMSNLAAAFGNAQITRFNDIAYGKGRTYRRYDGIPYGRRQDMTKSDAPWACVRLFRDPQAVAKHLAACGVETRPVFPRIATQKPYLDRPPVYNAEADFVAVHGLVLPSYAQMTNEEFVVVAKAFEAMPEGMKKSEREFVERA